MISGKKKHTHCTDAAHIAPRKSNVTAESDERKQTHIIRKTIYRMKLWSQLWVEAMCVTVRVEHCYEFLGHFLNKQNVNPKAQNFMCCVWCVEPCTWGRNYSGEIPSWEKRRIYKYKERVKKKRPTWSEIWRRNHDGYNQQRQNSNESECYNKRRK